MSHINLESLGVSVEELQNFESEELNDLIESVLANKSTEERAAIMQEILAELPEAAASLEQMIEGLEEDVEKYEDMDNEKRVEDLEEEIDELDLMLDYLEDAAESELTAAELEYNRTHFTSSDDLMISNASYKDGETVFITAERNLAELEPAVPYEEFIKGQTNYNGDTDINGMPIINYTDYELYLADQKQAMFDGDTYQEIFLTLDPGDELINYEFTGDSVTYTISNGSKTTNFVINNISKGVHIFFDSTDDAFIESCGYKNWPAELQKLTYFGDTTLSVFETLNAVTDAEKLTYVQGYEETKDAVAAIAAEFSSPSHVETVSERVSNYVDSLFGYYNAAAGTTTIDKVWSSIYTDMASLDQSIQTEILTTLMYTVASANDQARTTELFDGQISKIEDIYFNSGELSETELMSIMFMESSIGVGYYGGGDNFWAQPVIVPGTETGPTGIVFYTNAAGNIEVNPDLEYAQHFSDLEKSASAMEKLLDSLKFVSWASDNGAITTKISALKEKDEIKDSKQTDVVTDSQATKASTININNEDVNGAFDGINKDPYVQYLGSMISLITSGKPVDQLASEILALLNDPSVDADWKDDLAAGFVFYVNRDCPQLMRSLCASGGFAKKIRNTINNGNNKPERMEAALAVLNQYT